MIKVLFISVLTSLSIAHANQALLRTQPSGLLRMEALQPPVVGIYKRLIDKEEFPKVGTYIFRHEFSKQYIADKRSYFQRILQSKWNQASKIEMKRFEALQDEASRFDAYSRALETCLVTIPVSNEGQQSSSAGIQSSWCVDMKRSFAADLVKDLARSRGISQVELESNQELVGQLIQELRESKKMTMVEAEQMGSLRNYQRPTSNFLQPKPEASL